MVSFLMFSERSLDLARQLQSICLKHSYSVSLAESCTGGLLSSLLTDIPGSSSYFLGAHVVYSNALKTSALNVSEETLEKYGAVSEAVALEMVKGLVLSTGSDIGVSITGIAGPGGGSIEKPVGTIWVGFYILGENFTIFLKNTGQRAVIKQKVCIKILHVILKSLKKIV